MGFDLDRHCSDFHKGGIRFLTANSFSMGTGSIVVRSGTRSFLDWFPTIRAGQAGGHSLEDRNRSEEGPNTSGTNVLDTIRTFTIPRQKNEPVFCSSCFNRGLGWQLLLCTLFMGGAGLLGRAGAFGHGGPER